VNRQGKQDDKKSSVYQPKPKRYQVSIFDEPEYQEDFEKKLKKVIENVLLEHTHPKLIEEKNEEEEEEELKEQTVDIEMVDESTKALVAVNIISENKNMDDKQPTEQILTTEKMINQGSSDCALIPKRDIDRSRYFRFFI
jgi:hypothetical protein